MGKGIATSFIPSIVKQGGKAVGAYNDTNYQKIAVEFDEYVQKALNFSDLNKQYDFLGREIEGMGAYTIEKKDPITDEWLATKTELTPVKKGKAFAKRILNS